MPTFGYTSVGGFSASLTEDYKRASNFNLPEAALVSKLSAYVEGGGSAQALRAVVYSDAGSLRKAVSDEVVIGVAASAAWVDFPLPAAVALPAADYWLGLIAGATSGQANYYYAERFYRQRTNPDAYSDSASDPWGELTTVANRKMCIYATYTLRDTGVPEVDVTAPVAGAVVSGAAVSITADAADDVGVAGVTFFANGVQVGAEDTAAPYSASWDTTAVADGAYSLVATARDAAGNTTTSAPVEVTVNNVTDVAAPTCSVAFAGPV